MSTSGETIIYLSDQLTSLGNRIRTRKMFGEYAMYCDERVVALICDDQVFVKITEPGKLFVGSKYQEGFPYPGAKPAMLIGGDIIENKEAFAQLIDVTARALPLPKPKKPKGKNNMSKTKAYDFSLQDQDGVMRSLHDYVGKWVVLYFYPKDDTPGCTKEACNFRDSFHELESRGAVVIGISKDSVASHKKFADKYNLQFPLLSDPDHSVIEKYSAWGEKKFIGRVFLGILRMTYLIDPEGYVVKTYENVNPTIHAKEILADLLQ